MPSFLALFSINSTVFLAISRIHDQKYQIKVYLVMALQFLKQLCHEHGILTAGNTDSDLIALLHQFILHGLPW